MLKAHLAHALLILSLNAAFSVKLLFPQTWMSHNHGHNILRICDVLPIFPFTTSETKPDY